MLTPQEAEAHVFPKASFGGYNQLQVDAFVESLIEDYRTLYQENSSLKSKMKVLVDKVEEYRATEDAMRMTLHSAQKMADAMVKEGEKKKNEAIELAVTEVRRQSEAARAEMVKEEQAVQARVDKVKADLANEEARLQAARASTTAYIAKLKELYTKELEYIGGLSKLTVTSAPKTAPAQQAEPAKPAEPAQAAPQAAEPAKAEEPTVTVSPEEQAAVAEDIEASMAKIFDDPAAPQAHKPDLGDTRVFDQIQFGKDHEIE